MAKFLTRSELFRLLQRELPEGVYPDGSPSAYYSTASIDSKAALAAAMYQNMERIYLNYFPQDADERIDDWVFKAFGYLFDSSTSLAVKRERVIAKLRKQPTITQWEILTLVASYVPEGTYVQVQTPCGINGFWSLGESLLGESTFLLSVTASDLGADLAHWCDFVSSLHWRLGVDGLGDNTELADISYADVASVQADAFLYYIRIFGYALSDLDLMRLKQEVAQAEPARAAHVVFQNLSLNDFGLVNVVNDVGQFSQVDCITRDPGSATGYTGRTT